MKVSSGLALFACFGVCSARISNFEKEVIAPSSSRDLQSDENCKICDGETDKEDKPQELFFQFTDNWNQQSFQMGESDSNCHTIDPSDILRGENGEIELVIQRYGRFNSLNQGDRFKVVKGKGAFTIMQFKTQGGGTTTCYIHTSCSKPLVAGDTHGPFTLLDLGSCPAPPPEGQCTICDKENKENKNKPITVQYVAAGKDSAYQDGQKASCVADQYPTPAVVTVNGKTFDVEDGTVFTFDPEDSAETTFSINGDECFIHTSCSVPIVVGDQIGPFLITGGAGCGPPGECDPDAECTICDSNNKDNKPKSLVLKYHKDGMNSNYQPEGKASCRAGAYPETTTLTVLGESFVITDGQEFTITTDDKFDAETDFSFSSGFVDECFIHTSCSVPLVTGDRIGPFEVVAGGECPKCENKKCLEASVRQVDGRYVVDVTFDYEDLSPNREFVYYCHEKDENCPMTDLTPVGSDWIGLYPCSDSEGSFNVEPDFWSYTCYDEDIGNGKGRCRNGPGIGKGTITLDDNTAPPFYIQGVYNPIEELSAGCYVVLLNRYEGYSPPPYYNICISNNITLGE
mmetsp:Transcript_24237/g.35914  ORF Transcript_24237/g.35914 Transcript_24237/m.35914 type:complete len:571 (-) Transcript_24237:148-1860(-)|eukprot:CAMPEP_0194210698 /NCGR_PEP_ID=MMETSP0156-20130528/8974_1 /TAXON_ID=33649 /ORGANISM="Thalassionema nitzschioides, Strain L26-B" /LENGTH=570 /DNA_ID=CAMNT_0038938077 /DNA_START=41 /DNA_END=1753 /DNA_ORIENTATION=-